MEYKTTLAKIQEGISIFKEEGHNATDLICSRKVINLLNKHRKLSYNPAALEFVSESIRKRRNKHYFGTFLGLDIWREWKLKGELIFLIDKNDFKYISNDVFKLPPTLQPICKLTTD